MGLSWAGGPQGGPPLLCPARPVCPAQRRYIANAGEGDVEGEGDGEVSEVEGARVTEGAFGREEMR